MRLGCHVWEIPLSGDLLEGAVAVPGPAVERTGNPCAEARAFATNESGAAMGAAVPEGMNFAGLISRNDDRVGQTYAGLYTF